MALISKKKIPYKVNAALRSYLVNYGRERKLPLKYSDLKRFDNRIALLDKNNNDTLWETVFYPPSDIDEIYYNLKIIYADLKTDGNADVLDHLVVDRVDTCTYANTSPFRVRIINKVNDNYDYFYIKNADSSRVYGLELEHLLSPNVIGYVTYGETLVEEHIAGIPGDIFMEYHLNDFRLNPIRLAKEFIKFNERCFARLLGDMHSANFVIIVTPDFEDFHYRIRAIDFDQQSYEGSKSVYMPQYFRQNNPIIELGIKYMTPESVKQYQTEERSLIANRIKSGRHRLYDLMKVMKKDHNFLEENLAKIIEDLNEHYETKKFKTCKNMAEVLELNLRLLTRSIFKEGNKHKKPAQN